MEKKVKIEEGFTSWIPKTITAATAGFAAQHAGAAVVSIEGTAAAPVATLIGSAAPTGTDLGGLLYSSLFLFGVSAPGGTPLAYFTAYAGPVASAGAFGFTAFRSTGAQAATPASLTTGFLITYSSGLDTRFGLQPNPSENWILGAFRIDGVNQPAVGPPDFTFAWINVLATPPIAGNAPQLDIIGFHYDDAASGSLVDQVTLGFPLTKLPGGAVIVPEPSRVVLLALGAAGVLSQRRRRKEAV